MVESPPGMSFCHECGAKIAPDDPFCGNCGVAQPADARSADKSDALPSAPAESSALAASAESGSSEEAVPSSQLDVTVNPDSDSPRGNLEDTESPEAQSL
ncbi:MAG TPA: zinc ribbon domain-containing protein, partial [Pyrinomonadaceae bacterium]|nr:zinc ribbon domain-containing protein [Pyrinomonadaceae bacterium]